MNRSAWLAPLAGQTILVVDDDPLIAFDIETTLTNAGASVVTANDQHTGLAAVNGPNLTAAVLDVRLALESVDPICESLERRWVPFLFLTGGSGAAAQKWTPAPILFKPFAAGSLIDGVVGILVTGRDALDLNDRVRIDLIIFRAQIRLAKQERLLESLTRTERDTHSAEGLLRIMRESVDLLQAHRRTLTDAGEIHH